MLSNCSKAGSVLGVILCFQRLLEILMFKGLLLRIPRGVVMGNVIKFVVDAEDGGAKGQKLSYDHKRA